VSDEKDLHFYACRRGGWCATETENLARSGRVLRGEALNFLPGSPVDFFGSFFKGFWKGYF